MTGLDGLSAWIGACFVMAIWNVLDGLFLLAALQVVVLVGLGIELRHRVRRQRDGVRHFQMTEAQMRAALETFRQHQENK